MVEGRGQKSEPGFPLGSGLVVEDRPSELSCSNTTQDYK